MTVSNQSNTLQTLSRKEAQEYQKSLRHEDKLCREISHILAVHESGIHPLSNGQKLNATRFRMLGGSETVEGAISVTIASKTKGQSYIYEAPEGKYIKSYKIACEGKDQDIKRVEYGLHSFGPNSKITEKEGKNWEKGGELGIKEGFTQLDATAGGTFKSISDQTHDRESSNQMVVLNIKAKKGDFFETEGPVKMRVDVILDPLAEKQVVLSKEVVAKVSESISHEGSIEAVVGNQPVLERLVKSITKLEAIVFKCTAKKDIKAESNVPPTATSVQMEKHVDIEALRSEIDRIDKDLAQLNEQLSEVEKKYENTKNEVMQQRHLKKMDDLESKINEKEERKRAYEAQIDSLLTEKKT